MIELFRTYREEGAFGIMTLEDQSVFYTVERPNLNNIPKTSCIPEGVYRLGLRQSPMIERTSQGEYTTGWEVMDVPNRDFIMIHIANLPTEVEGCIGIGLKQGYLAGKFAVLQSRDAFERFMTKLAGRTEWYLEIKSSRSS